MCSGARAHSVTPHSQSSKPVEAVPTSLLDVAPTVYAALRVAGPKMDGQSLLGGLGTAEHATRSAKQESIYTPEQEAVVEERLRGLGYFE